MRGIGEAGDRPHRGQDGDRREQGHAGDLDEQRDALVVGDDFGHFFFQHGLLLLSKGQRRQVGLDAYLLQRRDFERFPPGLEIGMEQLETFRRQDVVAVQHRVQAVLSDGAQAAHLAPLAGQDAQVADVIIRHPDAVQHPGGQQLGQGLGGFFVRLHLRLDDGLDVLGMDDQDVEGLGGEQVVDLPGVSGHLDGYRIGVVDLALDPALEILPLDAARTVDDLLLRVHGHRDHEELVDIQPEKTSWLDHRNLLPNGR